MHADDDDNTDLVAVHTWKVDDTEFGCVRDKVCPHLAIYPGDGQGNFASPHLVKLNDLPDMQIEDPFVEDADLDGLDDLVFESIGGYPEVRKIFYARRQPNGGLDQPRLLLDVTGEGSPLFFGDLNSDGLRDVIHGSVVHFRKTDGGFQSPVLLATYTMDAYWNVLDDFDGDGHTDVVNHQFKSFSNNWTFFATYLQKDGQLQPPFLLDDPQTTHFVNTDKWGRQAAASGDFNSDGCRDIAVAAKYSGILFLEGRNCIQKAP